jgi:hypothetical protein
MHSPHKLIGRDVYSYRNFHWPARCDQRIVLHLGECMHCNDWYGVTGATPLVDPEHPLAGFPQRAWIGPFASIGAANVWLAGFSYARGQLAERCQVCCGVPNYLPCNW